MEEVWVCMDARMAEVRGERGEGDILMVKEEKQGRKVAMSISGSWR